MTILKMLSGGAANGLINAVRESLRASSSCEIEGEFGAVGGMFDRVVAGEYVDVVILSKKLIQELASLDLLIPETCFDLGEVVTGFAVPLGHIAPTLDTTDAVRNALLNSEAVYTADVKKATAGIHFQSVLAKLGVLSNVEKSLRIFPNGQTAMAAMAKNKEPSALGCTQITEILNTPGVDWVAPLPVGLDLTTIYSAGISKRSKNQAQALDLLGLLTSPTTNETRKKVGFS
jgi:molybdate transport system substrate-binding protein